MRALLASIACLASPSAFAQDCRGMGLERVQVAYGIGAYQEMTHPSHGLLVGGRIGGVAPSYRFDRGRTGHNGSAFHNHVAQLTWLDREEEGPQRYCLSVAGVFGQAWVVNAEGTGQNVKITNVAVPVALGIASRRQPLGAWESWSFVRPQAMLGVRDGVAYDRDGETELDGGGYFRVGVTGGLSAQRGPVFVGVSLWYILFRGDSLSLDGTLGVTF